MMVYSEDEIKDDLRQIGRTILIAGILMLLEEWLRNKDKGSGSGSESVISPLGF